MTSQQIWNPTPAQAAMLAYWLDGRIGDALEANGGYPYDYRIFAGCLVIASVDYKGAPNLDVLTLDEAIAEAAGFDILISESGPFDAGREITIDVPYEGDYVSSDELLPDMKEAA